MIRLLEEAISLALQGAKNWLVHDFQVVKIERQPWDVPLDGLITPSGLRWFKPTHIDEYELETLAPIRLILFTNTRQ